MVFILKHIWRGDCKNYTVCSYWNLNSSSASRESYEALKLGHLVLGPRQGKVHTEFHPTSVTLQAPCGVYSRSLSEGWGFLMGIGELCDKMGSLSWEMWCWKKKKYQVLHPVAVSSSLNLDTVWWEAHRVIQVPPQMDLICPFLLWGNNHISLSLFQEWFILSLSDHWPLDLDLPLLCWWSFGHLPHSEG